MLTENWLENELDFGGFTGLDNLGEAINKKVQLIIDETNNRISDSIIRINNRNQHLNNILNNLNNMSTNWENQTWNGGRSSVNWGSNNSSWNSQNWNQFYGLGATPIRRSRRTDEQITFKFSISYFAYTDNDDNTSFKKLFDKFVISFNSAIKKRNGWESEITSEYAEYDDKKSIVAIKDSLIVKYFDNKERENIIKEVKQFFEHFAGCISFISPSWTNYLKVNDNGNWKEIFTSQNNVYNVTVETSTLIENLWLVAFCEWLDKREFTKYVKLISDRKENKFELKLEVIKPFIDKDEIAYIFYNCPIGKFVTAVHVTNITNNQQESFYKSPLNIVCKEYFKNNSVDFVTTEAPVAPQKPVKVIDETKKRYRKCVYEIIKEIDEIDGIPVKAYIVKKHRGKLEGKRYTLNQHDCELLGIEYRNNLEILPYDMQFGDVYKMVKYDD